MVDIGDLGGEIYSVYGMNENGRVTGLGYTSSGALHAFTWTQASGMVDLGSLPGDDFSYPEGVNSHDLIVGQSSGHAFGWTPSAGMFDLGVPQEPSRAYDVNDADQVVGQNNYHATLWNVSLSMASRPATPGAPTATAGDAAAGVTWTAPADGGSPITKYIVTSSAGQSLTVDAPALTAHFTGLTNGTTYTFTVVARNGVGDSDPSPASNAVTPMTTPGTPGNVVASPGNGQVTVTWSAPVSNGGASITSYTVTSSNGVSVPVNQQPPTFTATVPNQPNCSAYTYSVAATNAAGQGGSSQSAATIPRATVQVSVDDKQTKGLYVPQSIIRENDQCVQVDWKFLGTNKWPHQVKESSSVIGSSPAGLGLNGAPLFDSQFVNPNGSYSYFFQGATGYQYRSTSSKDNQSVAYWGLVSMPVIATPSTGSSTTSFTVQWASNPIPGLRFNIEYQFQAAKKGSQWGNWTALPGNPQNQTALSRTFGPTLAKGSYRFRSRAVGPSNQLGGASQTISQPCSCQITVN